MNCENEVAKAKAAIAKSEADRAKALAAWNKAYARRVNP